MGLYPQLTMLSVGYTKIPIDNGPYNGLLTKSLSKKRLKLSSMPRLMRHQVLQVASVLTWTNFLVTCINDYCHFISTGGALIWFLAAYLAHQVLFSCILMFLGYIT